LIPSGRRESGHACSGARELCRPRGSMSWSFSVSRREGPVQGLSERLQGLQPQVERLARDEELHAHVRNAYDSGRLIYERVLGGPTRNGTPRRGPRRRQTEATFELFGVPASLLSGQTLGISLHTRRPTGLRITP